MKLNKEFNKKIEPIVNSSRTLTIWFDRNQDLMTYYGLTFPGCLQYEEYDLADEDLRTLGRMANYCLTVLENYNTSYKNKIEHAIKGMTIIYMTEKENLSDVGRLRLAIDTKENINNTSINYHLSDYYYKQI